AARSFTDWPGFMNSAFPRIVQPVSSEARRSRIRGVLPMASTIPLRIIACVSRFAKPPAAAAGPSCTLDCNRAGDGRGPVSLAGSVGERRFGGLGRTAAQGPFFHHRDEGERQGETEDGGSEDEAKDRRKIDAAVGDRVGQRLGAK